MIKLNAVLIITLFFSLPSFAVLYENTFIPIDLIEAKNNTQKIIDKILDKGGHPWLPIQESIPPECTEGLQRLLTHYTHLDLLMDDRPDDEKLFQAFTRAKEKYEREERRCTELKRHLVEEKWRQFQRAHVELAAEIIGMYPGYDIYFLARDAEFLSDIAKSLTLNTSTFNYLHLINVSRRTVHDPHLLEYLANEGITEEKLSKDQKVLFMDTGYIGNIPTLIREKISRQYSPSHFQQIKTQLILSRNPIYPSSRVFLRHLNSDSKIAVLEPTELELGFGGELARYEKLPKMTFASQEYVWGDQDLFWTECPDKSERISDPDEIPLLDPTFATLIREDNKFFAELPETQALFQKSLKMWQSLRNHLAEGDTNDVEALLDALKVEVPPHYTAVLYDLHNIVSTNFPEWLNYLPSLLPEGGESSR